MNEYTITHRSGWTIYSDCHGIVWIRGVYRTPEDFPDLSKMRSSDCFCTPLTQNVRRQGLAI